MGTDYKDKFSTTTFIKLSRSTPTGDYGRITPVSTFGALSTSDYGRITPVSTFGALGTSDYGHITPMSGLPAQGRETNVSGVGDIIYYGSAGSITLSDCTMLGAIDDPVLASGLVLTSGDAAALTDASSNSVVFSVAASTAVLPSGATEGVYLYFSNHDGLTFSVSGVNPIVSATGVSNVVSLSGVGSHLGLIGDGTQWIATEEGGIVL